MTGIERLRELIDENGPGRYITVPMVDGTYQGVYIAATRNICDKLCIIYDQIKSDIDNERDRWDSDLCEAQMDRTRVMSVYLEMNRHVLGHEGAEDSPVARWVRELREALGGEGCDPADLLPADDREAAAWVLEHGGLDYVKSEWRSRVPYDRYERRRQRLLGHIAECERALGRRNERIEELERSLSEAVSAQLASDAALYDLRREVRGQCQAFGVDVSGCEIASEMLHDMNEALSFRLMPEGCEWPRYESGEPVGFGDEVSRLGEVFSISLYCDGSFALNFRAYSKGERVRRPAPKVLDADGVEIRVGDVLYSIETGDSVTVDSIEPGNPWFAATDGTLRHCAKLTHRAPVLAADGRPLCEGETVWEVETGDGYVVERIYSGTTEPDFPGHTVACRRPDDIVTHMFKPSQLTHERPDNWERIEEDAKSLCHDIAMYLGDYSPSDFEKSGDSVQDRVIETVRRGRALAERERGE